jgi:hypothetical protein
MAPSTSLSISPTNCRENQIRIAANSPSRCRAAHPSFDEVAGQPGGAERGPPVPEIAARGGVPTERRTPILPQFRRLLGVDVGLWASWRDNGGCECVQWGRTLK